jgi:hypothetical protein
VHLSSGGRGFEIGVQDRETCQAILLYAIKGSTKSIGGDSFQDGPVDEPARRSWHESERMNWLIFDLGLFVLVLRAVQVLSLLVRVIAGDRRLATRGLLIHWVFRDGEVLVAPVSWEPGSTRMPVGSDGVTQERTSFGLCLAIHFLFSQRLVPLT